MGGRESGKLDVWGKGLTRLSTEKNPILLGGDVKSEMLDENTNSKDFSMKGLKKKFRA